MNKSLISKANVLLLFSDTGGGHRSAAEAIIEALKLEYGETINVNMIDFFKDYTPRPFNSLPVLYPAMVRVPQAWGLGYKLSNGGRRSKILTSSAWPYVRRSIRRLISQNPSDLVLSVHPVASAAIPRATFPQRLPFITVVTDMVTTHAFWYNRRTDLCLVPTQQAADRAIRFGLKPEQVRVVGLPVADRFCKPAGDKMALRRNFGWSEKRPLVLLVGGGEGMGPLERTARVIAEQCPSTSLVIIAGRNKKLERQLKKQEWPIPTFVYGFVREMPDFMRAADILVTKAGPGTISEALIAGLPMVLYSRLPGQEDGNITHVASNGAGVWAPKPDQISSAINNWLRSPEQYEEAVQACNNLARPDAARTIAHIIAEQLGVPVN
jgi:1,2-diacylglycerol 3-beta-galactosyltransferase